MQDLLCLFYGCDIIGTYTSHWVVEDDDVNGDPPNVNADGISHEYSVAWSACLSSLSVHSNNPNHPTYIISSPEISRYI